MRVLICVKDASGLVDFCAALNRFTDDLVADANTAAVLKKVKPPRLSTFGFSNGADYFPDRIKRKGDHSTFDCMTNGKLLGTFHLNLPGLHNIANALGVIALADELRIPLPVIQETLETFKGVQRRLEMNQFPSLTIVPQARFAGMTFSAMVSPFSRTIVLPGGTTSILPSACRTGVSPPAMYFPSGVLPRAIFT